MRQLILITSMMLWSVIAWGEDPFNPTNPAEPSMRFNLTVGSTGGGTVSPSGKTQYKAGEKVTVKATASTGYEFVAWLQDSDTISLNSSFTYTIPEKDSYLTAVFEALPEEPFDPSNPADPDAKYFLTTIAYPAEGGTLTPSGRGQYKSGTSVSVKAVASANYEFVAWMCSGDTISTNASFSYTIPDKDSYLTAIFNLSDAGSGEEEEDPFSPSNPSEPNVNSWDSETGVLLIDRFTAGSILAAVDAAIGGSSNRSKVKKIIVSGTMGSSDFNNLSRYLTGCAEYDLKRSSGYTAIPDNAFSGNSVITTLILPDCVEKIGANAFYNCTKLNDVTCYASQPPVAVSSSFSNIAEGAILRVMATSVDLYSVADVWKDFIILPITNDMAIEKSEYEVLQAIYDSLDGKNWNNKWNLSDTLSMSVKLYGVEVSEGHITEINLSGNNLKGVLPSQIFQLPMLKSLNLSDNDISGDVNVVTPINDTTICALATVDFTNNALTGNIGEFISQLPNLVNVKASNNHISHIYPSFDATRINVELKNQILSDTLVFDMTSELSLMSGIESMPEVINHSLDGIYRLIIKTTEDAPELEFGFILDNGQKKYNVLSNSNVFNNEDGSIINIVSNNPITAGSIINAQIKFLNGDADFSATVDVLDVQALLQYSFNDYNNAPFNYTAANLYTDETINIQDVVCTVNEILSQPISVPVSMYSNSNEYTDAVIYWKGNDLILKTTKEIAALDIVNKGVSDMNWTINRSAFVVSSRNVDVYNRAVIYSPNGSTFPVGEMVIATAANVNAPRVISATFADINAHNISVGCNREISSVEIPKVNASLILQNSEYLSLLVIEDTSELKCKIYDSKGKMIALKEYRDLNAGEQIDLIENIAKNQLLIISIETNRQSIVEKIIVK